MANFHLEVQAISHGKGQSVTRLANYITGRRLHDGYNGKTYYRQRHDVLYCKIFQPSIAPPGFYDLQYLCDMLEGAEHRCDARTAREIKGSLPNELPFPELIRIVDEYIHTNFVVWGLCAIAAIHEGRNTTDPAKNNPHVHIIVSTRTVGPGGFCKKKYRELDKRECITIWREQWAAVQNRAYERNGLDIQVSHESLEVQGIDRKPVNHLSRIDWQKEQRGERTAAGNKNRAIKTWNKSRILQRQLEQERELEIERY